MPQTVAMNETVTALSSMSDWSGIIMVVGVATVLLLIITIISSVRSMGVAYS